MKLNIIPVLIGVFAFFLVTGGEILSPTNIDWLMKGDPATHWIGWHFFRDSPLLQFPIGQNKSYGMAISSSIVFTDSIPLLAFIFKPFTSLLPDTFQYIGMWILLCFILQSYFAWKLLLLFTKNRVLASLGTIFFAFAPIYLFRLSGHYALFAHWVLLAGLYFYFKKEFSFLKWLLLLIIASLIHAYLLMMLLFLIFTDMIQRYYLDQLSKLQIIKLLLIAAVSLFVSMYSTGYFMISSGVGTIGFGFYNMDLLSLIDSQGLWSYFIPNQQGTKGDAEGFNYLGTGMLFLAIFVLFQLSYKIPVWNKYQKTTLLPILILFIFLFLYAISNHIAIAGSEVLTYPLPSISDYFTQTFRASGRFFWLDYYLIYLSLFYIIFTKIKPNFAIILLTILLLIQIIDMKYAWQRYGDKFINSPKYSLKMKSDIWQNIAKEYKHISMVLPQNKPKSWLPLSHFAANNNMTINTGFFARVNSIKLSQEQEKLQNIVMQNKYLDDTLYVFNNDYLYKMALDKMSKTDIAIKVDSFYLLLPNVKNRVLFKKFEFKKKSDYKYSNKKLSFKLTQKQNKYQVYGWANSEADGVWSVGKKSLLRIDFPASINKNVQLSINSFALLTPTQQNQKVEIIINQQHIGFLDYTQKMNQSPRELMIPKEIFTKNNGKLLIEFKYKYLFSPKDLGISNDQRILSFKLISLDFSI